MHHNFFSRVWNTCNYHGIIHQILVVNENMKPHNIIYYEYLILSCEIKF